MESFLTDARDIGLCIIQGLGGYHVLEKDLEIWSGRWVRWFYCQSFSRLRDEAHKYLSEILRLGWGGCHQVLILDLNNPGACFGVLPGVVGPTCFLILRKEFEASRGFSSSPGLEESQGQTQGLKWQELLLLPLHPQYQKAFARNGSGSG